MYTIVELELTLEYLQVNIQLEEVDLNVELHFHKHLSPIIVKKNDKLLILSLY